MINETEADGEAVLGHLLGDHVLDSLVVNLFNLLHLEIDPRLINLVILYEDEELVIVLNVVAQDVAWMLLLCHAHALEGNLSLAGFHNLTILFHTDFI